MLCRLLVVGLVVFGGGVAHATVMEEVSLDQMVQDADVIVRGRVVSNRVEQTHDIYTISVIEVSEWLKGTGSQQVGVSELGGATSSQGFWIAGTPQYPVGEEVVAFLRTDSSAPTGFRTFAMSQGKFVVLPGVPGTPSVVRRDLSEMSFASWTWFGMVLQDHNATDLQLDMFLDWIRNRRSR